MKRMPRVTCFLALVTLITPASIALASMCDTLSSHVDESRIGLKRAVDSTDLDDAQAHVRRAQYALESASLAAIDCECVMAYSGFDDAATRARRARNASDADEFADQLRRAIRAYNDAVDAIGYCAAE